MHSYLHSTCIEVMANSDNVLRGGLTGKHIDVDALLHVGSAGSTAGGFKVIRGIIISRIAKNQILSTLSPNRVLTLHINGAVIDKDTQHKVLKYLAVYILIILALIFIKCGQFFLFFCKQGGILGYG